MQSKTENIVVPETLLRFCRRLSPIAVMFVLIIILVANASFIAGQASSPNAHCIDMIRQQLEAINKRLHTLELTTEMKQRDVATFGTNYNAMREEMRGIGTRLSALEAKMEMLLHKTKD